MIWVFRDSTQITILLRQAHVSWLWVVKYFDARIDVVVRPRNKHNQHNYNTASNTATTLRCLSMLFIVADNITACRFNVHSIRWAALAAGSWQRTLMELSGRLAVPMLFVAF